MEYDGILFDLDGTLWDATAQVAESWNDTIQEVRDLLAPYGKGKLLTAGDVRALCGVTMDAIADELFGSCPDKRALADRCYSRETEYLLRHPGRVFDGLGGVLEALAEKTSLFVVSNCQIGYIEAFLETSGWSHLFSGHLSFGDTGRQKWENIRTVCRQYGLRRPIYVGDTQHDADAAKRAGAAFVHVRYGFGTADHADLFIDTPEELMKILEL